MNGAEMATKTSYLIDTNVWRYLSDANAGSELRRRVRASGSRILVAPSVLYETLRMSDPILRKRISLLITSASWLRLMPEVYSESQELLTAIRRLRPEWLHPKQDRKKFTKYRYDWTRKKGGFWDRVRMDADKAAVAVNILGASSLEAARLGVTELRRFGKNNPKFERVPLDLLLAGFPAPTPGWRGDKIEPWRIASCDDTRRAFRDSSHPYAEWLSGEIDFDRALFDQHSWGRFWFYDVDRRSLPRFWIRWAFEHLQQFRTTTDGSACDSQLATYLSEADVFVTADKNFVAIGEQCRSFAPSHFPKLHRIPGGNPGVEALLDLVGRSQFVK